MVNRDNGNTTIVNENIYLKKKQTIQEARGQKFNLLGVVGWHSSFFLGSNVLQTKQYKDTT